MEEKNIIINEKTVLDKYEKAIKYYWGASCYNKRYYKLSRFSIIILGALVTLMSSLISAEFIDDSEVLKISFAVMTPLVAALLTIISGFSQSFHWGAAWRDMVINAQKLEKARDLFLASKPEERDLKKELDKMNNLLIEETQSFFQRVLESEVKPKEKADDDIKG